MQEKGQDFKVENKHYVYLLRCWQEVDSSWRYTVEPVDDRSLPRRGFPNQAALALLAYLKTILPDK